MIARRRLLAALALAPFVAGAQAASRRRVALVGFASMFGGENGLDEVVRVLAARGHAEGARIDVARWVIEPPPPEEEGRALAYLERTIRGRLAVAKPDVIVTMGSIMTRGVHLATRTVPVVAALADPVDLGVAESLARPGGNVTGLAQGVAETAVKALELAKVLVPRLARLSIFHDARPLATRFAAHYERAARRVGLEPVMHASLEVKGLVQALRGLPAGGVQAGLYCWGPPEDPGEFFREAQARRLPLLGVQESDAEAGCLVSYYASEPPAPPRLAAIVEHVLRGADPATIPFQYPQTFRLVVNARTAKALGFIVPPELMLRADRVIE